MSSTILIVEYLTPAVNNIISDTPKKELKGKLKALKDGMYGFVNMDENTFDLIEAMSNGLKTVVTIQDSFSKMNKSY
jgi:hypothetical protein